MRNGLYKVAFATQGGSGAGVVVLDNGAVRGGDSMMFYVGRYVVEGGEFSATVLADTHSTVPGMGSVFGVNKVNIALKGKVGEDTATLQGSSPDAPGVSFQAELTRLSD